MAQVWEATDEVLARRVAVKILHPHLAADDAFVARFRREAVAAARLSHPSIVSIYDTCAGADCEAIVMELVQGVTLRQLLDERKWLEPSQAISIVAQVADALETAHRGGIVHRDVKPGNILLSNDGRVLVADFGIAKAGADLTATNTTLGTAKYLAPEQVEGAAVDARADVYALGVVLYETLCGRAPFNADSETALALARLHQEPMRPRNVRAGVPKALEDVVLKAMARDPDARYATAADFRAALLATDRGKGPSEPLTFTQPTHAADATIATPRVTRDPTPPGAAPPAFVRTERGWLVPTLVIVLVAAALIIAGVLLAGSGGLPHIGNSGTDTSNNAAKAISLTAAAFDPFGDATENDDKAALATDGDASTAWQTQGYDDQDIKIKPGVGLYVTLSNAAALKDIKVNSSTSNWSAEIYVADSPKNDLAGWGTPVATKSGIAAGTTTFDLKGATGGAVLIWITNVGTDSTDDSGRFHTRIAEVSVDQK